jgi:hypothetical protein
MPTNPRAAALAALLVSACGSASRPASAPAAAPAAPIAGAPASTDYLTGARIAAAGDGALVMDADSGLLIQTDRAGGAVTSLAIGRGAGLLAYDPVRRTAFVADRRGDRIAVVDASGAELRLAAAWATPAEPFGVALTPDRATVLVTAIADRRLVAYDAVTGAEQWRAVTSPEPRGIAVSPDGARALVSPIAIGALDDVNLATHEVAAIPLDLACDSCATGTAFARASGAARFLDAQRAVASFQRSVPVVLLDFDTHAYGGGEAAPVTHHVAFLSFDGAGPPVQQAQARVPEHQPRTLGWDAKLDALYVGGFGSDTMLVLGGLSEKSTDELAFDAFDFLMGTSDRCGPDGMVVRPDSTALVWCAFMRTVLQLDALDADGTRAAQPALTEGPVVAATGMSYDEHHGLVLFNGTVRQINVDGALACATCHPDGRADGLTWKIGELAVQTPVLAGRITGTGPYKWAGTDATLDASLHTTVTRLRGEGLTPGQTDSLIAYLQQLERPRPPTGDAAAIARGKAVFEGDGGCTQCHGGAAYTDGHRHHFDPSTLASADTPSLVGLSTSAPYFHDGSAATLADVVAGKGGVAMVDTSHLTDAQRADLAAFLRSL